MQRRRRADATGPVSPLPPTAPAADAQRPRRRFPARVIAFGVLVALCVVLFSIVVPLAIALSGEPAPYAFLFGALLCAAPIVAVRYPRWAIALFTVAAVLLPLAATTHGATEWPWPWSVPALLTLVLFVGTLTVVHGWRYGLAGWLLAIAGTLAAVFGMSATVAVTAPIVNLVIVTSISGACLLVAVLAASRLRVGAELSRERAFGAEEHDRRVAVEERARIARELHDVVAHGMSLIQVQASTARYRIPGLSDTAADEFDAIAGTARESLTEMRRLLGVLRTEDQEVELAPQQGLDGIPALVDGIRRAGARIAFEAPRIPDGVPPGVGVAAFRIVQESLSNALRHAPEAPVDLSLSIDAEAVRIVVRNGAPQHPGTAGPGRGHGLLGMRERAALVGGTLVAGPDPDGGWTVRAELPLKENT